MIKDMLIFSFLPMLLLSVPSYAAGKDKIATATFAGGCFWCVQPVFEYMKGVKSTVAGYANGKDKDPTYEDYTEKGYVEAVQVTYDPAVVTYEALLENFWMQINPTDEGGQFVDRGAQYRPAIFWRDDEQKKAALAYKEKMSKSGKYDAPIKVEISAFVNFYPAEEYHQDYHKKNAFRYNIYRMGTGRDAYIKKIWGDIKKK